MRVAVMLCVAAVAASQGSESVEVPPPGASANETCTSASGRTVALCSHDPLPIGTGNTSGSDTPVLVANQP